MTLGTGWEFFRLGNRLGSWGSWACLLFLLGAANRARAGHYAQQYNGSLPWPGGVVYYEFDDSVTNRVKGTYLDAMREWELAGHIQFVPRTNNEGHYLKLVFDARAIGSSLTLGPVPVLTVNTLARWQLCHQLGHGLGLAHENYRTDRDTYITILTNNLQRGALIGLSPILSGGVPFGPYDFESVMHPARIDGSIAPGVLDALQANAPYQRYQLRMGGRAALSVGDRAAVAALYGAPPVLSPVVTTTADGGVGSLRAAIYYANDHPGTTITFNIATNDPGYTNGTAWIRPTGQLPTITADGTVIDATSQPAYAGQPLIVLDGSREIPEVGGSPGLELLAANCVVRALNIQQFTGGGLGFLFTDATNNRVEGCYIGTGPTGTNSAANVGVGLSLVFGASYNVIGGTNAAQRNVISGNQDAGIVIRGTNSIGNRIVGNFIGLDATGTNRLESTQTGIQIIDGASSNVVGGVTGGSRNYISGNAGSGVLIASQTAGNVVQGNYIGLDSTGTNAVPNGGAGVAISGPATGNLIGGSAPGAGNTIAGNPSYGVAVAGVGADNNLIQGNWIGLDATGQAALGNGIGVDIFGGAKFNTVGGADAGAGNTISGNVSSGVVLSDTNTVYNFVTGNTIGLDPQGLVSIPNHGAGVFVHSAASGNFVGGSLEGQRNFISGNDGSGVSLEDAYTTGNSVIGNYIGVGRTLTNALGNGQAGVAVLSGAAGNFVGGPYPGVGNVIVANQSYGVAIAGSGTSNTVVQGNFVGADFSDFVAGNGNGIGLFQGAHDNLVGGLTLWERNLISGNNGSGIVLDGTNTVNNTVQNNRIGTTYDGKRVLGNGGEGIFIRNGAGATLIGGTDAGAGNLISGNAGSGIVVSGGQAAGVVIQGNTIGGNAAQTASVTNGVVGVWLKLSAHDNVVGLDRFGNGMGNFIGYNEAGVVVEDDTSTGNSIRGNSLPHNQGPGIFFFSSTVSGGAPLPNDPGDADAGPNNLQNYPLLDTVEPTMNGWAISGRFNSTPNREFYLDFYRNPATNGTGYGEARSYVGSLKVTTGADGAAAPFVFQAAGTDPAAFTATATDTVTGDTSELSPVAIHLAVPAFSGPLYYSDTNGLHLGFTAGVGQSYRIQTTTNLAGGNWSDLQSVPAGTGGLQTFDLRSTNDFRFYRLVSP